MSKSEDEGEFAFLDTMAGEAARALRRRGIRPTDVCLVLGSGIAGLAAALDRPHTIPYREIRGMPHPHTPGHAGLLRHGRMGGREVLVLEGRTHYYEGATSGELVFPILLAKSLGVRTLILTCAAGGISPHLFPGDLLLVEDQVNLSARNPLREMRAAGFRRFVDMISPFDRELSACISGAARDEGIVVSRGVLAAVHGPCYETAAEVEALRRMGVAAVTMSTIPEVIVSRYLGMKIACISLITNSYTCAYAVSTSVKRTISHDEVLESAASASPLLSRLIAATLRSLHRRH